MVIAQPEPSAGYTTAGHNPTRFDTASLVLPVAVRDGPVPDNVRELLKRHNFDPLYELGRGGEGAVFLAADLTVCESHRLEDLYALKIINPHVQLPERRL